MTQIRPILIHAWTVHEPRSYVPLHLRLVSACTAGLKEWSGVKPVQRLGEKKVADSVPPPMEKDVNLCSTPPMDAVPNNGWNRQPAKAVVQCARYARRQRAMYVGDPSEDRLVNPRDVLHALLLPDELTNLIHTTKIHIKSYTGLWLISSNWLKWRKTTHWPRTWGQRQRCLCFDIVTYK